MQIQSKLVTKGHLKVVLRYDDGTSRVHVDEDNLVVYAGRDLVLKPLYLAGLTSDPIRALHVGDGGSIDPQGLYPKVPTTDMSALYNDRLTLATTYTVGSGSLPSVTYQASVSQSQLNGTMINEAALYTQGGIMFNIKTFTGIPKTSYFAVDFEWTLQVL